MAALLALENATGITPGEIILGLAGWMLIEAHQLPSSIIFVGGFYTALGCTLGASTTYWVARLGGRPLIDTMVRWARMDASHIDRAEAQFQHWGASLTLFGRFVPGLRVLISAPAGLARMPFFTYLFATFIGVYVYCTLLIGAGCVLGHEWPLLVAYAGEFMPHLLVLGFAALVVYFMKRYHAALLKILPLQANDK